MCDQHSVHSQKGIYNSGDNMYSTRGYICLLLKFVSCLIYDGVYAVELVVLYPSN